jgi:chromosome segregation ATPase
MKAFSFPLDGVLKVQERKQRLAEMRQRLAQRAVADADGVVARWHAELQRSADELRADLHRPGALEAHSARAGWLGRALAAAEQQARQARAELSRADAHLRQASSAVEALRSLRRRRWQEHRAQLAAEQQQRLDEYVLRQWAQPDAVASPQEELP